jgi:hypothetical protein
MTDSRHNPLVLGMAWQSVNFKLEVLASSDNARRACDRHELEQLRLDREYMQRYGEARSDDVQDAAHVVSHIRLVLPPDVAAGVVALSDERCGRIYATLENHVVDTEPDARMAGVWLALAHAWPDTCESLFDLVDSALDGDPDDIISRVRADGAHDPDASSPTVEVVLFW